MRTIDTLLKRIDTLLQQLDQSRTPRTWRLVLEVGSPIPPDIQAQIRPCDTLIIREIPKGFLS